MDFKMENSIKKKPNLCANPKAIALISLFGRPKMLKRKFKELTLSLSGMTNLEFLLKISTHFRANASLQMGHQGCHYEQIAKSTLQVQY